MNAWEKGKRDANTAAKSAVSRSFEKIAKVANEIADPEVKARLVAAVAVGQAYTKIIR